MKEVVHGYYMCIKTASDFSHEVKKTVVMVLIFLTTLVLSIIVCVN